MSQGRGYTRVHVVPLVEDSDKDKSLGTAGDAGDGSASDAIMSALYRQCSESSSRCLVYFGSKHYSKDYIPLTIRYSKEFISYKDENGNVRYSFCDAIISGPQCDFEFSYLQEADGGIKMFVKPFEGPSELGLLVRPQDEELEPVAAWVRESYLYLVMNTPSDDMLATVAPRDRLPLTGKNGGRAFGSMSLWRIPIGEGRLERTELTVPMDGWCASVIPNADDGRPGVMIVNMSPHTARDNEPKTFSDLLDAMRAVTSPEKESDVPIGVSVYDPENRSFERISLGGHVDWGIGSIQFVDPAAMPKEIGEAEMDDMGVSLLVYDSNPQDEQDDDLPGDDTTPEYAEMADMDDLLGDEIAVEENENIDDVAE